MIFCIGDTLKESRQKKKEIRIDC